MINASYSNQSILALFGRTGAAPLPLLPPKVQPVAKPVVVQTPVAGAGAASAPDAKSSSGDPFMGMDMGSIRPDEEQRAAEARAQIAMWEAGEAAFERENGFRREVNSDLIGFHSRATSGNLPRGGGGSHEEAARFALNQITFAWGHVQTENSITKGLADPAHVQAAVEVHGLTTSQTTAKMEDRREAARMNSAIEAAILDAKFEVTGGPLLGRHNGMQFMNDVEVRRDGKLVLTVAQNGGAVTTYDAAGEAVATRALDGFDWYVPRTEAEAKAEPPAA